MKIGSVSYDYIHNGSQSRKIEQNWDWKERKTLFVEMFAMPAKTLGIENTLIYIYLPLKSLWKDLRGKTIKPKYAR